MRIAYFDCIAGASGDMILGALLDAGAPEAALREGLAKLRLQNEFDLKVRRVSKNGFTAAKVDVLVRDPVPARRVPEILDIIATSDLSYAIKLRAGEIIQRLGQVEARIHGVAPDQVHLHELGGVDTIVDIVGAILALKALEIGEVVASPLPVGRGFVRGAHGQIPLPAPATAELLKGVPLVGMDIDKELVTPTGAALLSSLSSTFGPMPPMILENVGYGAGGRDLPIPNLLRVFIGEASPAGGADLETLVELQTNIDDLNPEIYEHVMARLFAAGALDVYLETILMKKNRPGVRMNVLCRPAQADALRSILFLETTTLGIRQRQVMRYSLPRFTRSVETPYGAVRLKLARLADGALKSSPEYEDCRRLALDHDVPLREVYLAAQSALADIARDPIE
jgi:uncharacterized protein (TIGR00299 family) protein